MERVTADWMRYALSSSSRSIRCSVPLADNSRGRTLQEPLQHCAVHKIFQAILSQKNTNVLAPLSSIVLILCGLVMKGVPKIELETCGGFKLTLLVIFCSKMKMMC